MFVRLVRQKLVFGDDVLKRRHLLRESGEGQ